MMTVFLPQALRTLIHIMNTIGDVVVVAPDSPQSGMGHAVTINNTLHLEAISIDDGPQKGVHL